MNQCDGCMAGYPVDEWGIHKVPYASGSMVCQRSKYTKEIHMTNDVTDDRHIDLDDTQAAIVINSDGTAHIHLPDPEDDEATPAHILATALGYLLCENPDVVMYAIDTVLEDAHKYDDKAEVLEEGDKDSVSSDTKEAKDDQVQGD